MTSYAKVLRSCSRELARIGCPGEGLQPVSTLVKKACRTYDKGAKCFATAARVSMADGGVIAGTPRSGLRVGPSNAAARLRGTAATSSPKPSQRARRSRPKPDTDGRPHGWCRASTGPTSAHGWPPQPSKLASVFYVGRRHAGRYPGVKPEVNLTSPLTGETRQTRDRPLASDELSSNRPRQHRSSAHAHGAFAQIGQAVDAGHDQRGAETGEELLGVSTTGASTWRSAPTAAGESPAAAPHGSGTPTAARSWLGSATRNDTR